MTVENELSDGGINWNEIKSEFINGSLSLIQISNKYTLKDTTVRSRAKREDWQRQRNELQRIATQMVNEELTNEKVDKLKALNEVDLQAAHDLRKKANELMETVTTANELKALSGTFDIAQKISRLALGASTENSTVTSKELPASVDEFV